MCWGRVAVTGSDFKTQTFGFNRFTSSGREPCRCTVGSGRGGGNRGLRFASDAHGGRPHDGAKAIAIPRLRCKGGRRHDECSVESLEPRQYLSVNDGTSGALLLWQGSAPAGQLPPAPPAAVSGLPSTSNGLLVAPIGPGISAPSGGLVSSSGGLSQGGPGDQSISGGGLLGGGPGTTPSGGGSSSGTSPTGTPSGAPYSGGGQPSGGTPSDVLDQLARTWREYGQDWYNWAKPGLNILWGIAETGFGQVAPPGYAELPGVMGGAAEASGPIIIAAQEKRVVQALEELKRLKELENNRRNP